jgi:hypothetical protein
MKIGERMKSNLKVNKDLVSLLLWVYLVTLALILATNLWMQPSQVGMVVPDGPEVHRMIVPDAPEAARMVVPDGPEATRMTVPDSPE